MSRTVAGLYFTKTGQEGARIFREEGRHSATYSHIGKWGAGSGLPYEDMARHVREWTRTKRGFTVAHDFFTEA